MNSHTCMFHILGSAGEVHQCTWVGKERHIAPGSGWSRSDGRMHMQDVHVLQVVSRGPHVGLCVCMRVCHGREISRQMYSCATHTFKGVAVIVKSSK